jgi:hypothetical protein
MTTRVTKKPRVAKATRANPARGEHAIKLGGVTYLLRPTFAACSAIETSLDQSLLEIWQAANTQKLSYQEIGICLAELIRAGAEDVLTKQVSADRLAELVFEAGMGSSTVILFLCLSDAISGGRTTSGEPKAQTTPIP